MKVGEFPGLDWMADVAVLSRTGADYRFSSATSVRSRLAVRLDLVSLDRFEVLGKITARKKNRFLVTGRLQAKLAQSCVVTLKPVEAILDLEFERVFEAVEDWRESDGETDGPLEVVIDPEEQDPPELFDGRSIDIGKISLEEFALHVDPYPRHASAAEWRNSDFSQTAPDVAGDKGKNNPFAVLQDLKGDAKPES